MKLWMENVWSRCPGGIRKERSLLVWDMFRSHIKENSKARLSRTLPQPIDANLSKPVKDNEREEWNNWMLHGEKSFPKGGSMRAASLDILYESVIKACDILCEPVI